MKYVGQTAIKRDIENLAAAMRANRVEEVFMTAVSPATLQILPNEYYKNAEEYTLALAEAIREEYKAIVDAGFILQIDDPALVDIYDWWFSMKGDLAGYRKWATFQVDVLNHALAGIPEDRVRFHICWGSWHGPHRGDVQLKDVVDLLLKVKAQAYVIEAGNVRHEHEWKIWKETKLPQGKILIPGVVSHATNVLEHPELIADRSYSIRKCRRTGKCNRWDRLRSRRTGPSTDRLGKIGSTIRGCEARVEGVMGLKAKKSRCRELRTECNKEEAMSDHVTRRRFNAGIGAAFMSPGLAAYPAFAQGNSPVKIGLIMPYSGQFADTGVQIENGIKLYMKQHGDTVAGRKIELINKDVGGPARRWPSDWRRNWWPATTSISLRVSR